MQKRYIKILLLSVITLFYGHFCLKAAEQQSIIPESVIIEDYNNTLLDDFFWHVKSNDIDSVRKMIKKYSDHIVNMTDKWGTTSLHIAACYGAQATLQELLNAGAQLNTQDNNGWTALHLAAQQGWVRCVDMLIELGAKIDMLTLNGSWTPFHAAARCNQVACMKKLYAKDPTLVDRTDENQRTALHIVAGAGYLASVQWLIVYAAAQCDVRDNKGLFPEDCAGNVQKYYLRDIIRSARCSGSKAGLLIVARGVSSAACHTCKQTIEINSNFVTLDCLHNFHVACAMLWPGSERHCPVCNMNIVGVGKESLCIRRSVTEF